MTHISKELTHLEAVGLIKLVQTHPELEYLFQHGLIQEAAYNSLLFEDRKKLHRQVGEAIEQSYPNRLEELASTLADHFVKAEEFEKAIHYLLLAGDQARGLYAHQEAITHYQQALELLEEREDYERAARTLMKLGLTYHNTFNFRQSRQAYEEGFALWQKAGEERLASLPSAAPHALKWMLDFSVLTVDPALSNDSPSNMVIAQLFSGLVEPGAEMELLPHIAQSWTISDAGQRYVFHLRDDVYWSDGTWVTAADFEYSWKRILNPATGASGASLLYDIKGAKAFHQGQLLNPDEVGIWASDEVTLVVELEQPAGYFLYVVALPKCYPVPQQIIEQYGDAWTEPGNIVSNGPFLLEVWKPGQLMVFSRNPGYNDRVVGNIQRVELTFQAEYSSKALGPYEANQTDVVTLVEVQLNYVRQRYPDEYISLPGLTTGYISFNLNRPPFDDPRVRRAFALAFDREQLAASHLGDPLFMATGGFIPAGMPGHSAGNGLPCNRLMARQLLAEAGYPDGQGFPQISMLGPGMADYGEGIQQQWETHLGVRINRQQLEFSALFERLEKTPPHIYTLGWAADYPDPDSFLRTGVEFISQRNGWQNDTYDKLIAEARGLADQKTRMQLYQQADRILVEEAVIVPFLYRRQHLLVKPWIKNISISPLEDRPWKNIIIEPH